MVPDRDMFGTGIHAGRDTSETPQVVLLDLKLPKLNGLEVLRTIRSHPHTKLLPVIILTTSREESDLVCARCRYGEQRE